MIMHNWDSAIKEVAFTSEIMYICKISCLKYIFNPTCPDPGRRENTFLRFKHISFWCLKKFYDGH